MANPEHVAILHQGVPAWNEWRNTNTDIEPDLSEADLTGFNLSGAELWQTNLMRATLVDVDFSEAKLSRANLQQAKFSQPALLHGSVLREVNLSQVDLTGVMLEGMDLTAANLSGSCLRKCDLSKSTLLFADLQRADLRNAHMNGADLRGANLSDADLSNASLQRVNLVQTKLARANLTGCLVYGISAWDLELEETLQSNLIITRGDQPAITTDDLEVAQFLYLLLNNRRIRKVIDNITSKAVLILGRFTPERKVVLDALREELRHRHYLPILFDFDPSVSQSRMETVSTLAHMARFVIADISDARTVLQELQAIVPSRPSLPVQPILLSSQKEPGMFDFLHLYPSFLPTVYYDDPSKLIETLTARVIEPAEHMARELMKRLEAVRRAE